MAVRARQPRPRSYHRTVEDDAFVSYSQNGEDVVLGRALRSIRSGRYIDVGANDPTIDSVTKAFYDAGWRGITVEPVREFADRQRAERPDDMLIEAVVTTTSGETARLLEVPGTGLSSLDESIGEQHRRSGFQVREVRVPTRRLDDILDQSGWSNTDDIHFLKVDVEGAEAAVLGSLDLRRWRPWIIVAEATRPQTSEPTHQSWEPLLTSAGYRFSLFDGLSRYYIADERWEQLHPYLSAPANPLDNFVRNDLVQRDQRIGDLEGQLAALQRQLAEVRLLSQEREARAVAGEERAIATALAWRSRAVGAWADSVGSSTIAGADDADLLRRHNSDLTQQIDALRATVSWRVTRPLRTVRLVGKRVNR